LKIAWAWWYKLVISATQEAKVGRLRSEAQSRQKCEDLIRNILKPKRAVDVSQVVECFLSKHKGLSLSSSTTKRKTTLINMLITTSFTLHELT
jgi:hypothetical protein